jgi:hypothetical protein
MAVDAKISIEVIAKIANYTKQMEEAANKTKESTQKMQTEFEKLSAGIKELGKLTAYLGTIYAVGRFFGNAIKETNEYNLEINKLSKSMDITLAKASALKEALGDLGIDSNIVRMAQQRLTIAMQQNEVAFRVLKVSIKDANGNLRSSFDVLMDVIEATKQYTSETDRSAVLSRIFGRGFEQTKELLRLTKEEMASASEEVVKFGRVVDNEGIAKTRAWNRSVGDLGDQIADIFKSIGKATMALLAIFNEAFRTDLIINYFAELKELEKQNNKVAQSGKRLSYAELALLSGSDGDYDKFFKTLDKIDETFGKEKAPNFTPYYAFFNELEKLATPQVLGAFNIEESIAQVDVGLESVKERFAELRRIEEESFSEIFNAMTSQFASSLTAMITGTITATEGIRQIFASMITSLINLFIQMGLEWVKTELMKMLFTQKTQAVITGTKVAGTAAELGMESASVGTVVAGESIKGAAKTTAWWAGVNPLVALGLGAAMGAAIAALAGGFKSAAGGWANVPVDGAMAQLHKGEMVLPASLAEGVRNMVDTGQSGGVNNYYIQAMDASSFDAYVKANAGSIFAANRLAIRNGSQFA